MAAKGGRPLEAGIARLLMVGTYAALVSVTVGVVLMVVTGRSPDEHGPALDPGRLFADLLSFEPIGFLWAGILIVLATPLARVAAALVGYVRAGEREMVLVGALIIGVIALGVVAGTLGG